MASWSAKPRSDFLAIVLLGSLIVLIGNVELIPQDRGGVQPVGQVSRHVTCPMAHEITPCSCRVMSKGLDIVCDNSDAKHIQSALDRLKKNTFTIYWMKLRSCVLPRIKDYIFLGLDIRHLNIIRSNVSVIEKSSLSALGESLTDLDLSNNNIHEVPTASFSHLRALTFLNLNYNKIQSLHESAFAGLTLLERLTLYENNIKHIHDNAFKGIGRKLARLNLGKNRLQEIPTDTFHPLKNLFVLDMNENMIKHLPDGAFLGLHRLDMLKLEHNQITSLQDEVFSDLTVLNSLNVEYNKITNISNNAFKGLENNLGWLELGHNQLDHIPSYALRPLHNLRQLDLDANRIVEVPEDAFKGYGDTLKFLLLDKNHIVNIPPLTFIELHSLEWLKLSHNELQTLTEDTVQPILDTLTHIDVSNNPLVCNCEIYWLYQWLVDPNNSENVESTDDHRCSTPDNKVHTIKLLSDDDFNCKRKTRIKQVSLPNCEILLDQQIQRNGNQGNSETTSGMTNFRLQSKPKEVPFTNDTAHIEVDVQGQPQDNVTERVSTIPVQKPPKGRTSYASSVIFSRPSSGSILVLTMLIIVN